MTQLRWCAAVVALILAGSLTAVLAHGGEYHDSKTVLGTVKVVHKDKIEIETPKGEKITIALRPDTDYTRDGEKLTKKAVEPGMRVAMDVTEGEHGEMVCHRMMLGSMPTGEHDMSAMHEEHHDHDHEQHEDP